MNNSKWLCCHCLKTGKGRGTCGTQGHRIVSVSHKLHFPKITSSAKKWLKMLHVDTWAGVNLAGRDMESYLILMKTLKRKDKK